VSCVLLYWRRGETREEESEKGRGWSLIERTPSGLGRVGPDHRHLRRGGKQTPSTNGPARHSTCEPRAMIGFSPHFAFNLGSHVLRLYQSPSSTLRGPVVRRGWCFVR
jgi:hypothetical protein